jgi:hypothetical protein
VQGLKMTLAIIGLVCQEARVKIKNIDFRTEADFDYYCKYNGLSIFLAPMSDESSRRRYIYRGRSWPRKYRFVVLDTLRKWLGPAYNNLTVLFEHSSPNQLFR